MNINLFSSLYLNSEVTLRLVGALFIGQRSQSVNRMNNKWQTFPSIFDHKWTTQRLKYFWQKGIIWIWLQYRLPVNN